MSAKPGLEVTKSEILRDEKLPIGNVVSEGASRPLISEKSPEVRKEVIQQIVKSAEEKVIAAATSKRRMIGLMADGHRW